MRGSLAHILGLVGFAMAIPFSPSASAQTDIRPLLIGNKYLCTEFLFVISFQKNGGVRLLFLESSDGYETVARIAPRDVSWQRTSVSFRDSKGSIKMYVGSGPNPKLLADITHPAATGEPLKGTPCEIEK